MPELGVKRARRASRRECSRLLGPLPHSFFDENNLQPHWITLTADRKPRPPSLCARAHVCATNLTGHHLQARQRMGGCITTASSDHPTLRAALVRSEQRLLRTASVLFGLSRRKISSVMRVMLRSEPDIELRCFFKLAKVELERCTHALHHLFRGLAS